MYSYIYRCTFVHTRTYSYQYTKVYSTKDGQVTNISAYIMKAVHNKRNNMPGMAPPSKRAAGGWKGGSGSHRALPCFVEQMR